MTCEVIVILSETKGSYLLLGDGLDLTVQGRGFSRALAISQTRGFNPCGRTI